MTSHTHSLSKSRKAQFFVLSAFAIVTVIYFIGRWVEPYTIIDTSSAVLMEEPFVFNNIMEKAEASVYASKTYEELGYNLEEYRQFVLDYILRKGYYVNFTYTITPPGVTIYMKLKSTKITLESTHIVNWQPS